ncbi:MgtC/SapB family protein [uncultured Clostridium sp.]|uniref:MgtC/SapB family protein n=1 Tax=uncultured Clostridium sp. TaxID=59620 RepID=UPI00263544F1|nr:MgtC/SapB family protein [uncultured Clostridium sp.]
MKEIVGFFGSLNIQVDFIIRLLLAVILGGVIGYERESHSKEAGLKTHILVCVGSALIMIVSQYGFSEVLGTYVNVDPSRIAAQVVSGIGFLGAGVIFKDNSSIKGLSTAAGVWCVAAIGLVIGSGMYILGVCSTIIILIVFSVLSRIGRKFYNNHLEIQIKTNSNGYQSFKEFLEDNNAIILSTKVTLVDNEITISNFKFKIKTNNEAKDIIAKVENSENITLEFFEIS